MTFGFTLDLAPLSWEEESDWNADKLSGLSPNTVLFNIGTDAEEDSGSQHELRRRRMRATGRRARSLTTARRSLPLAAPPLFTEQAELVARVESVERQMAEKASSDALMVLQMQVLELAAKQERVLEQVAEVRAQLQERACQVSSESAGDVSRQALAGADEKASMRAERAPAFELESQAACASAEAAKEATYRLESRMAVLAEQVGTMFSSMMTKLSDKATKTYVDEQVLKAHEEHRSIAADAAQRFEERIAMLCSEVASLEQKMAATDDCGSVSTPVGHFVRRPFDCVESPIRLGLPGKLCESLGETSTVCSETCMSDLLSPNRAFVGKTRCGPEAFVSFEYVDAKVQQASDSFQEAICSLKKEVPSLVQSSVESSVERLSGGRLPKDEACSSMTKTIPSSWELSEPKLSKRFLQDQSEKEEHQQLLREQMVSVKEDLCRADSSGHRRLMGEES